MRRIAVAVAAVITLAGVGIVVSWIGSSRSNVHPGQVQLIQSGSSGNGATDAWALSCPSKLACVAGGDYETNAWGGSAWFPYVAAESQGVWQLGIPLRPNTSGSDGQILSVSCPSAGNCAAAGFFTPPQNQPFVINERNGVWSSIHFLGGENVGFTTPYPQAEVSCPIANECTAVGGYTDRRNVTHTFWARQHDGVWSSLHFFPTSVLRNARVPWSISCTAPGSCIAHTWRHGKTFELVESGGAWRGIAVSLVWNATRLGCVSSSLCYLGSPNLRPSRTFHLVVLHHGLIAGTVTLPAARVRFNHGKFFASDIGQIGCSTDGRCVASAIVQLDRRSNPPEYALISTERGGKWSSPHPLPGYLSQLDTVAVESIACTKSGACIVAGSYRDKLGASHAFAVPV